MPINLNKCLTSIKVTSSDYLSKAAYDPDNTLHQAMKLDRHPCYALSLDVRMTYSNKTMQYHNKNFCNLRYRRKDFLAELQQGK